MDKFTFILLATISILLFGVFSVPVVINNFGILPGIVFSAILIIALSLSFMIGFSGREVEDKVLETIEKAGKKYKRRVIVKSRSGLVLFDKDGDLVPTQFGCFFFYTDSPLHIFAPKRRMLINNLTDAQILTPTIIIQGVVQYHADELYVETENRIIIKDKPSDYTTLKFSMNADDITTKEKNVQINIFPNEEMKIEEERKRLEGGAL